MADITVRLDGLEAVRSKLESLSKREAKKAITRGCRAGAKIVTAAAKGAAPVRSGATKQAVRTRAVTKSRKYFGVRTIIGAGWFKGKTFYAAFVEFGHKIGRRPTKAASRTGLDTRQEVPGKHWMERTADRTLASALRVTEQTIVDEIEKAAARG